MNIYWAPVTGGLHSSVSGQLTLFLAMFVVLFLIDSLMKGSK